MKKFDLFTGNGATFSPRFIDGMTKTDVIRLVADSGMAITDGIKTVECIDVPINNVDSWKDCNLPSESVEDNATADEILNIILGGETE